MSEQQNIPQFPVYQIPLAQIPEQLPMNYPPFMGFYGCSNGCMCNFNFPGFPVLIPSPPSPVPYIPYPNSLVYMNQLPYEAPIELAKKKKKNSKSREKSSADNILSHTENKNTLSNQFQNLSIENSQEHGSEVGYSNFSQTRGPITEDSRTIFDQHV